MGFAFRQGRSSHRRGGGQAREARAIIDEARRPASQQLGGIGAEMVHKARGPSHVDLVPDLIEHTGFRPLPAAHQAGVAPVLVGQNFDDQRALAVTPRRQDDTLIDPTHYSSKSRRMAAYRSRSSVQFSVTRTWMKRWTRRWNMASRSARAAAPMLLICRPSAPTTIAFCPSRATCTT